jgi:hypothetical protein
MNKKIIFLGDAHLSDRQIKTRVDDTVETCLEKFAWVLGHAVNNNANIIHTGDFLPCMVFNSKFRYQVKMLLRKARESGVLFYSISGNHDVSGADFSEFDYRELGQLCHDGYMSFLGPWMRSVQDYWLNNECGVIRGYSAYSELSSGDYAGLVVGLVVHHWIQDAFNDPLVVYPDDMKTMFPNLKFIVAGHDHAFHEPYVSRDGVLVIRPGSMMRTDSGASSNRMPGFYVWDPESSFGMDSWKYQEIACARPYSEVFYVERKAIDKESAGAIDAFVRQMNQNVDVVLDVNSVIKAQFDLLKDADKSFIRQDLVTNGFMV